VRAEWGISETGRKARTYQITPAGRKQLAKEVRNFDFLLANIARVMEGA
jgi:DNA-binding PadR family transcriptional regulator